MARQAQPPAIEIRPSKGGRLMAGLSAESADLSNYIIKRDWRRYLDREMRAEGYEGLVLNQLVTSSIQVTPPGSSVPLTVIAQAHRGDGKLTIVAGNKTTLWALTATEDTHYVLSAAGAADYFASGSYVDETQYGWIQIASGLSSAGRRWEAVVCGDFLVLNNGVDLPLTYRPGDMAAKPIYELREQQIASVGTIAVHGGILLCMDLWQINDADFANLMAPTQGAVNASVNSSGVVSVVAGTLFPSSTVAVGMSLFWATGQAAKIVSIDGSGNITTDQIQAIPSGVVYLENASAYAAFTNVSAMQRFPWRVLPSMQGQPRRFGAIIPAQANLGDYQLIFKYPVRSLPELVAYGQSGAYATTTTIGGPTDIAVLYANAGGSTLTTNVIGIKNDIAMSCQIADMVRSPITFSDAQNNPFSSIEASDAANSYAGTYVDLVDDGGTIIKALQLRDQIVIYKDTPTIYLGQFTGDLTTPYQFTRVVIANEGQSLQYRNTVIASGGGFYGSCHIYAGRNAFYKFDMFMQTPQEIPELQPAQDIFFQNAVADPENAYVAENPLTREWVWGWNGSGTGDRALCYDYAYKTCRTTSSDMLSAQKVQHPTRKDWLFIFGDSGGSVRRYGLWDAPVETPALTATISSNQVTASTAYFTTAHVGKSIVFASGDIVAITGYTSPTVVTVTGSAPNTTGSQAISILPGIWHRNGNAYDSILESGSGDLGFADTEKLITRYVPVSSSKSQNAVLQINFKAGINPENVPFVQSATVLTPVVGGNLVQPTFMGYYVGARLTISGINNPFELVNQIWQHIPIGDKSASRL
jgi:hypothetical protein